MNNYHCFFHGQELILSPHKALFWKERSILVLSDLHLGKAEHFRKAGVPVPSQIHLHDLLILENLVREFSPDKVIFLGDLFHSEYNSHWETFCDWLLNHDAVSFILVKGNHDILSYRQYLESSLVVVDEYEEMPFHFTHEKENTELYNISGHIHPSVKLRGKAKQSLNLPCFFFSGDHGLMPAFGQFTGYVKIAVSKGDYVFAISGSEVIPLMKA